ncbi:MAG: M28 family peptidase [Bacteroidales bacterium]
MNPYYSLAYCFIYLNLILAGNCSGSGVSDPDITTRELRQHIEYLASPELKGRYPGTPGDSLAAEYIKYQFINSGLDPGSENGFQYFTVISENGRSVLADDKVSPQAQPEVSRSGELHVNDPGAGADRNMIRTMNVIAGLRGNDPVFRDEYIIIGAHYDHLGAGKIPDVGQSNGNNHIYYGADDNASGVAVMLELAEKLSSNRKLLRRSYLFIAFGAEEKGLLGSRYFTMNPAVDLSSVKTMINLDMVGRKNEDKVLSIGGLEASGEGEKIIKPVAGQYDFSVVFMPRGAGFSSDHVPFYLKDIPAFFLTTGIHPDYHTPDDTAEKINYGGLTLISQFVYDLVLKLDQEDQIF